MPAPLRFYHRYKKRLETEQVFGERWLHFAYGNPLGRLGVWAFARRALFSQFYGAKMNNPVSALRILPFISKYEIDSDEFAKSPFDYKTFNEFFFRALKPESRPIAPGDDVAVFPADGRHLAFRDVATAPGFYVKGATFTLAELFGEAKLPENQRTLAQAFAGGAMLISRLCPVDYHRFHFPVSGTPEESRRIEGFLYSVNPVALRRNLRYLIANKREITLIHSPQFGRVAMVEVGATNVGSIRQTFVPGRPVQKGDEKGMFAFGGSCVITLFQRGRIHFDADILEQSGQYVETYAKMGDHLGAVLPSVR
jgi:phosphatidylserine decarboxylase